MPLETRHPFRPRNGFRTVLDVSVGTRIRRWLVCFGTWNSVWSVISRFPGRTAAALDFVLETALKRPCTQIYTRTYVWFVSAANIWSIESTVLFENVRSDSRSDRLLLNVLTVLACGFNRRPLNRAGNPHSTRCSHCWRDAFFRVYDRNFNNRRYPIWFPIVCAGFTPIVVTAGEAVSS